MSAGHKLAALESFARALASLRQARVTFDIAELAELYEVDWPAADEEGDEREETAEELAAAHRRRGSAAKGAG